MYDDTTLDNKATDGASLNLIKTNYYGFTKPNNTDGANVQWHGQYSNFAK